MPSGAASTDGLTAEEIDEDAIDAALYTAGLPPLDLVIRTGGEQRISNFLIWQAPTPSSTSPTCCGPTSAPTRFDAALLEFARRHRRFGR